VSGPLAMVVMGLIVGNQGRSNAMSEETERHVDMFWELIDEILNAVLFVLIGLEVILLHFTHMLLGVACIVILLTLFTRLLTVGVPVGLFNRLFRLPKGSWAVLTWGGLRGGISVALALSLPVGEYRDTVVSLTYLVVVFSVLVQGMSVGKLASRIRNGS